MIIEEEDQNPDRISRNASPSSIHDIQSKIQYKIIQFQIIKKHHIELSKEEKKFHATVNTKKNFIII